MLVCAMELVYADLNRKYVRTLYAFESKEKRKEPPLLKEAALFMEGNKKENEEGEEKGRYVPSLGGEDGEGAAKANGSSPLLHSLYRRNVAEICSQKKQNERESASRRKRLRFWRRCGKLNKTSVKGGAYRCANGSR